MGVIYVTDDPWMIDSSEEILGEWLDDHPGAAVLDSPWGDKNGRNTLAVSESKEGSNEAVFECHEYYSAMFNIKGVTEETVDETRIIYESYTNNAAVLAEIFQTIRSHRLSGNTGLSVTMYGMRMILQVTITESITRGALRICLSNLIVWYVCRINAKAQYTCLTRSSWIMVRIQTTGLCHLHTGILFIQRRATSLINLIVYRVKEHLIISVKSPMYDSISFLISMVHPNYSV